VNTECRYSAITLRIVIPSVFMLNLIMICVVMLIITVLRTFMLSVIILIVIAQSATAQCRII
jgi:hypothetical protein